MAFSSIWTILTSDFALIGQGGKVWKRDTGTGVSAYRLGRMERQRMTNSDVLLPGTARHTFEGAGGMLVMERGLSEWITESLFNDHIWWQFKRQNHVTRFSSAAECDGGDKMVFILTVPQGIHCP